MEPKEALREALMRAYVQGWESGRAGTRNDDRKHTAAYTIAEDLGADILAGPVVAAPRVLARINAGVLEVFVCEGELPAEILCIDHDCDGETGDGIRVVNGESALVHQEIETMSREAFDQEWNAWLGAPADPKELAERALEELIEWDVAQGRNESPAWALARRALRVLKGNGA